MQTLLNPFKLSAPVSAAELPLWLRRAMLLPLSRITERLHLFGQTKGLASISGYGPTLDHQGIAGFSPRFRLPGFHFRRLFLTHTHLGRRGGSFPACIAGLRRQQTHRVEGQHACPDYWQPGSVPSSICTLPTGPVASSPLYRAASFGGTSLGRWPKPLKL